jgi:hypothetical protein
MATNAIWYGMSVELGLEDLLCTCEHTVLSLRRSVEGVQGGRPPHHNIYYINHLNYTLRFVEGSAITIPI